MVRFRVSEDLLLVEKDDDCVHHIFIINDTALTLVNSHELVLNFSH